MDLKLILRISPLLLLLSGTSAAFNLPELDGGKLLLNKDKTGVFLACTNWSTFFYFVSKPLDFNSMVGERIDASVYNSPKLHFVTELVPQFKFRNRQFVPAGYRSVSGSFVHLDGTKLTITAFSLHLSDAQYEGPANVLLSVHTESRSIIVNTRFRDEFARLMKQVE